MTTWSSKTTYQGKTVNQGTKQIMAAANKMVRTKTFGSEKADITMVQGGYNKGGVSASAGTHDGGGAFDLSPYNWEHRIKVFRILGVAMWHRTAIVNLWAEHNHGIVCGDGTASPAGEAQVTEYYHGGDGLAGTHKDPNWRPKALPILFHLDGDLKKRYAKVACHVYDEPDTKGKDRGAVKKGDSFTPVAIVTVGKKHWFITADGKCGYDDNFTTTKPSTTTPAPAKKETVRIGSLNFPDKTKITTATEAARIKRAVAQINAANLDILGVQEGVGRSGPDKPSTLMAALLKALGTEWAVVVPTLDPNENYYLRRKATTDVQQHPDAVIRGSIGGVGLGGRHVSLATFTTAIGDITVGNTQLVNDNRPGASVQSGLAAKALSAIGGRRVLLGDFNDTAPFPGFTSNGLHDSRLIAKAVTNRDSATYTKQTKTTPSTNPYWVIDGIWVSDGIEVNGFTTVLDLDDKGNFVQPRVSDHSLIIVSLS